MFPHPRLRSLTLLLRFAGALLLLSALHTALATVTLDPYYQTHMVLQRGVPFSFRGAGTPGENLTVTFAGQSHTAQIAPDGTWSAPWPALTPGGPFQLSVTGTGSDSTTLDDVLAGDVWVASGQSNMAFSVASSLGLESLQDNMGPSTLRLGMVAPRRSSQPVVSGTVSWSPCDEKSVPAFSAVAYYFGRVLADRTHIPIGVIASDWGGTPIEAWMSHQALTSDPSFAPVFDRWQRMIQAYPAAKAKWDAGAKQRAADFQKQFQAATAQGVTPPLFPPPPPGPDSPGVPSCLWNGMIHPLTPFPIKGAIWYQGESNVGDAAGYARLFPAMIRDWRAQWHLGDFPFYFVQLPGFYAFQQPVAYPAESAWAELREAQDHTRTVPNTGMAVAIDVGEPDQIHPRNKRPVAERLALLALKNVYGRNVICEGPSFAGIRAVPLGVEITFKNFATRLVTGSFAPLRSFAVAGPDQKFVWAQAFITTPSKVLVKTPPGLSQIVSVRYNWGNAPNGNLYNSVGLPAEPFRASVTPAASASPAPQNQRS